MSDWNEKNAKAAAESAVRLMRDDQFDAEDAIKAAAHAYSCPASDVMRALRSMRHIEE